MLASRSKKRTRRGFAGVRTNRDGSTDYGQVDQPDRADNQITVRRERGGVVLEIAYEDEWVEVAIDPEGTVNLVAMIRAAIGG